MFFETVRELIEVVRKDAEGAKGVSCHDLREQQWIGFCIEYEGGTVTHNVPVVAVKEWDGCPFVGKMMERPEGRRTMAEAFAGGKPLHEDCDYCLASDVMEG